MALPDDAGGYAPNLDQARQDLRDGIEVSREIVRQTRMLIELSECDGSCLHENEERGFAG
ncbi:MAG TPA: hypothetical protein VM326_01205 [Sphingomicrobium sp.]|jgi:hypothetical protein|nr:hypothetical protein [Sphingomicrobium sp.]